MTGEPVAVALRVNGRREVGRAEPRVTLAEFLREELGLTGTHVGCEQGVCGACTVVVDGAAVRSCLLFAVQAAGCDVQTVEGLGQDGLHPLQQAFWDAQAVQCGFCTPGLLMTALVALRERADWDRAALRERLGGNLCRCTGYQTIVDAVLAAGRTLAGEDMAGEDMAGEDMAGEDMAGEDTAGEDTAGEDPMSQPGGEALR